MPRRHRRHSAAFKRQVGEERRSGEMLYALSKRHDICRQLIRVWIEKHEAEAHDDAAEAVDLIRERDARLATEALKAAIARPAAMPGCVFHAERGKHYASGPHRVLLGRQGFFGSMSRRGNPQDDSKAESFMKPKLHRTERGASSRCRPRASSECRWRVSAGKVIQRDGAPTAGDSLVPPPPKAGHPIAPQMNLCIENLKRPARTSAGDKMKDRGRKFSNILLILWCNLG